MNSQNDSRQDISGFAPYHSQFALSALTLAGNSKLSHNERKEHVERARQALSTAIMLRETLQPGTSATDSGELAVFSKASRSATALLQLGDRVMYRELDETLRLVALLRDIMVAVLQATDPLSAAAESMHAEAARVANLAMEASTRVTSKTIDHIPEMPCRTEAEIGISALFIAASLSQAVEEAWRTCRATAADCNLS